MMPVHIVRPIGKHEFIPAYSTDVLLNGVCHLVHIPPRQEWRSDEAEDFTDAPLGFYESLAIRAAKSREKWEQSKSEILALIARRRGVTSVAKEFHLGSKALKRYLWEEANK